MSRLVAAPLTIAQTLDVGFALFWRTIRPLLPLTLSRIALGILPVAIPLAVSFTGTPHGKFTAILNVVTQIVCALLNNALMLATLVWLDDHAEHRNRSTLRQSVGVGLRRLFPFIIAALGYSLALLIGFVLLIIPGLYVSVSLVLFICALTLEKDGGFAALNRSHSLVYGHWWRVASILSGELLLSTALYVGIGALLGLLYPFIAAALPALDNGTKAIFIAGATGVGIGLLSGLLTPLYLATALVMYRDLQARHSGSDLQARLDRLAPPRSGDTTTIGLAPVDAT